MSKEITCQICNAILKNNISFSGHLRYNHPFTYKEYYDKFLKEDMDGICLTCGNETTFIRMRYGKFCSNKCNTSNEKLNAERGLKQKETKRNNPEIVKTAITVRKETMRNNPEIMKDAGKKVSKTFEENPEIMKNAAKKLSIIRRNYYKTLSEKTSEETHYLYIMEHQTKPIIKIGLTNEKWLERRKADLNRDFGESIPILLLKSTYKKIDDLETYLHDHFDIHCKVQLEKRPGRTEWFDKEIMAEAVELASAKILES